MNGTSLKDLARSKITNPTRTFEELAERALKMEKKKARGAKKIEQESSNNSSNSGNSLDTSSSNTSSSFEGNKKYKAELKKL